MYSHETRAFKRTAPSLFSFVTDVVTRREAPLPALLIAYEQQLESATVTPDRSLLEAARPLLEERIHETPLDAETIRLGEALYRHLGAREAVIQLLTRYLEQPLPPQEEAWARWHIVDNLALLRRCEQMIAAQRALLQWAQRIFPVHECLWVMGDGTQALCWVTCDQDAEWLQIFDELMARAEPTAQNRLERFFYLRTAAVVLAQRGRIDDALQLVGKIEALAEEDADWERGDEVRSQARAVELELLQRAGHIAAVRQVGLQAMASLDAYERNRTPLSRDQERRLRTLYHNTAAPLYRAREYDLAVPLFRRAIRLGMASPHAYLWLAASLWATTKGRAEVLPLLREAAHRDARGGHWATYRHLPEFQDVGDDPQFEQAATVPRSRPRRVPSPL